MLNYREYDEFFKTCPIPCIYGVAIKDMNGSLIDFNIEDSNYSMCKLLNLNIDEIKYKSINYILPDIIINTLSSEVQSEESYIDSLNGWYKIDIIYLKENRYILWFIENKDINNIKVIEDIIPDYKLNITNKDANSYKTKDLDAIESKEIKNYYEEIILNNGILKSESAVSVGVLRDIIERKNIEYAIEKSRLESFANLSHELRTPLNLIFSSVQVLDKGYDIFNKKSGKKDDKYLPIIRQNGYRLLKLVDNIIDSSKMNCGEIDFEPKNYDIVSFIENICQSVSDFAKQNSMSIIFDTEIEESIIGFDLYKMERIMLNLLSNALKFNKKDGIISVFIKDNKKMIEISVKDEGIGIPENELDSVFDRFKQVKNKDSDTKVGSGIGLSLVKSLVEIHKGSISVKSTLGKGSEFIVKIPNITYDKESNWINNESLKDKFVQKIEVEFSDIYI